MKSRQSYLARVVGFATIVVMATACGGAKAKTAAAGGPSDAAVASNATPAGSAAAVAPVKATGGGSFCKLYAASVNSGHASGLAPGDAKARIEVARSDAHQALNIAPSEIKKDVAVLVDASDKMYGALAKVGYDYSKLTEADMSSLSSPQVAAAEEHLTGYIKGTCGIDVAAGIQADATGASGDAPAAGATDEAAAATDGGKACQLVTAAQISTAAGKPMHSVGGAGDTICVFSAVDDASFAMEIGIDNDTASMTTVKQLETEGSEHLDGLGDDAFWNATLGMVFVQKGTRAFSFTLPSFANMTDNPAAVKSKMVTLAQEALSNF